MLKDIIRKILSAIPLLLIVSVILFVMINALPGDAATAILGDGASVEAMEAYAEKMGYNDPVMVQYLRWLKNVLTGNWGRSTYSNEYVFDKIMQRLPVSAEVVCLSMLLSLLIALPLGILSAVKRNSILDYMSSTISVIGVSMPAFWLGILLVIVFAIQMNILPASGYYSISEGIWLNLRSLIMPVIAVSFSFSSVLLRQTRSAMLEVINQDYMMTARAKGLSKRTVLWKHGLRNAASPVATVVSSQIGNIICGMTVTEQVYRIPGMGNLLYNSILNRDYPVIMAQVMLMVVVVVFVNVLMDIVYILLDPRIAKSSTQ